MKTIVISVFIVVAAKCPSYAQEHSVVKVPIEVDSLSDDSVGERLAFQLREKIRRSTGYILTSANEPHMTLVLRTTDRDCLGKDKSTIYSIVWTFKKDKDIHFYIDSAIGHVGNNVIEQAAEGIIARTDSIMELTRKIENKNK
jgi:hypothetical protein